MGKIMDTGFKYESECTAPFDLEKVLLDDKIWCVTKSGKPAKVLGYYPDVHMCSKVVYKWAHLDVFGNLISWHIDTATPDGQGQLGAGNKLFLYTKDITLSATTLKIK